MTFLDTNVLVYAIDRLDPVKQDQAKTLVSKAICGGEFMISAQVLNEFSNVALRKLKFTIEEVRRCVAAYRHMKVVAFESDWTDRGLAIKSKYGIQFYDSLMIAAAEANGCDTILTEDLNDGQTYNGVRAVNPFAEKEVGP